MKQIPGHERNHVPLSEYLHKLLQPKLDDVFFLGKNFETCFDSFEALLSLALWDANVSVGDSGWGPIGRFGWKSRNDEGPLARLVTEGRRMGNSWPPVQAGLFGGSLERFESAALALLGNVSKLHWY